MNGQTLMQKLCVSAFLLGMTMMTHAGIPLWTFTPLTATTLSVSSGGSAIVQYRVQNQSSKPKRLVMLPMKGVTQTSTCVLNAKGQANSSCILNLTISGSALPASGIHGGPDLCQANSNDSPNANQCYRPSQNNTLNISLTQAPSTTLTVSLSELALSITGLTNGPFGPPVQSGSDRFITITNTGVFNAVNLRVNYPVWPAGTMSNTSCGSVLAAGSTCTITITPGNEPTTNGTTPCSDGTGTAPLPGSVTINADNAATVSTNVVVLDYGCIYRGGYLFSVDDSTPANTSIGGKVAALTNLEPNGSRWGPSGTSVGGISENSVAGPNSCAGNIDGSCNTSRIVAAQLIPPVVAPLCANLTVGEFSDWYLPSVCELGYDAFNNGSSCGTQVNPLLQNMYSNLKENGDKGQFSANGYWSSTEASSDPANNAWFPIFSSGVQLDLQKSDVGGRVRCARLLS